MGKYRFIDHHSNGHKSFVVEADNRASVEFGIQHNLLYVEGNIGKREFVQNGGYYKLHAYRAFAQSVVKALWNGDCAQGINSKKQEDGEKPRKPFPKMRKWVYDQTGKAIGHPLHDKWLELLDTVDPTIREIDKKIFAATFKPGKPDVSASEIAKRKYLLADVLNYTAAACAAEDAFFLSSRLPEQDLTNALKVNPTGNLAVYMEEDWKRLFSPKGETYTSLNRTLMNLPRQIPPGLLRMLTKIKLKKPITNRTQLAAILCATVQTGHFYRGWEGNTDAVLHRHRLLQHAPPEQFKKIVKIISDYTHNNFKHTRTGDIHAVMSFMFDCPPDHMHGSLTGWANRAVQYHRHELRARLEQQAKVTDPKTPLTQPPIDPPKHSSIKFLATVQDLLDEGTLMDHCIGDYASNAIQGVSFLFHVNHKKEAASVEVSDTGNVIQAWGPHNQKNLASQWGQRMLSTWGRKFPNYGTKSAREGDYERVTGMVEANFNPRRQRNVPKHS